MQSKGGDEQASTGDKRAQGGKGERRYRREASSDQREAERPQERDQAQTRQVARQQAFVVPGETPSLALRTRYRSYTTQPKGAHPLPATSASSAAGTRGGWGIQLASSHRNTRLGT